MPDLSLHEDSDALPLSQKQHIETARLLEPTAPDEPVLTQGRSPLETLAPAQRLLISLVRPDEQRHFAAGADQTGEESLSVLARLLTRERARRKQRSSLLLATVLILGIGGCGLVSMYLLTPYPVPTWLGIFTAAPLLFLLSRYDPIGRLEKTALEYLLQLEDPRTVGSLLEQRPLVSLTDRKGVDAALIRLLPQMNAEDMALLTPAQHNQFYEILEYSCRDRDIELRLAVIAVLEQIGERRSLGPLYLLAASDAATKDQQTVRAAAQQCLHILKARLVFGRVENISAYLSRYHIPADSQLSSTFIDADNMYALLSLLPQLTPASYQQILTTADKDQLYGFLSAANGVSYPYEKRQFYLEIICTLERVSDTRSLNTLRALASMDAPTDDAKQVRTAAKEAVRILRLQLEKEKVSQTLLRASAAPDARSEELLRAAAPTESETPSNELLRPATAQEAPLYNEQTL